jgi:hypothetical protein
MSMQVAGSPLKIFKEMKSGVIELNFDFEIQLQSESPDELKHQF